VEVLVVNELEEAVEAESKEVVPDVSLEAVEVEGEIQADEVPTLDLTACSSWTCWGLLV
jgi:hypothetical protein